MLLQDNASVFAYILSLEEELPYYLESLLPLWKERYQPLFTTAMLESSPWWIRRKVIGWALLDMALMQHTPISLPECTIEMKEHGKPEIINYPSIHYNLSHSGQYFLLGLSRFPIGVDIEVYRNISPKLAERFFTDLEKASLPTKEDPSFNQAFLQIWTKKESYTKALGSGFQASWEQIQTGDSIEPYTLFTDTKQSYILSICYRNTETLHQFPVLQISAIADFYLHQLKS